MTSDYEWQILGVGISLIGAIGGIVVRDRQVMKFISDGDEKLAKSIDEVKSDYVRRDDLRGHISSIEKSVYEIWTEQRETNRRIDALLTAMSKQNN